MKGKSPVAGTNSELELELFKNSESDRKSQVIVYLENSKIEEIDQISEQSGLSRSKVCREIIESGLNQLRGEP